MREKAFLVALGVAILGIGLLFLYLDEFEDRVSGGGQVPVLIAKKTIGVGDKLSIEHVGTGYIPQAYKQARHIDEADMGRIEGVPVRTQIQPNEYILWSDLAVNSEHTRDLSSLLNDGMRAVTIGTSGGAFGGLLRPGDIVDILLTVGDDPTTQRTMSLLQAVMVIAVGSDIGAGQQDELDKQTSVTFAVTMQQAQLLTFSGSLGRLSLTLRNPSDTKVIKGIPDTTVTDLVEVLRRQKVQTGRRPSGGGGPSGPQKL